MLVRRLVVRMFAIGMMIPGTGVVFGESYPNKPIRIVTSGAGGTADIVARAIARGITDGLGQQLIVDNRGGAIPAEIVSKATPDGYTVLVTGSLLWITPLMQGHAPYDPVTGFSPITVAVTAPGILVVHPSLPVRSVKELIALAKARPGELNYGHTTGGTTQAAGELFKALAGINIVNIPYKGSGQALIDLMSGQLQLMFPVLASAAPHVKAGRLSALAVTSPQPSALFPGLPTIAASGLPGYESQSIYGVFAPAGTPATVIKRLNQEIVRFVNTAAAKKLFLGRGAEIVGGSPEQLAETIRAEMARLGNVLKNANIRVK